MARLVKILILISELIKIPIRDATMVITLLYVHIKSTFFLFLINVFWGVDSKSEIHFFGQHWKTPIIRKKYIFFLFTWFSGVERKI